MRALVLGLAAAVAAGSLAAQATAETTDNPFAGLAAPSLPGDGGHHFDRRRGNGGVWINGGEWARYNNPAWQSSGYNDWWHDRSDRAYPAWVRNNQGCAKQWYAGSTLRC